MVVSYQFGRGKRWNNRKDGIGYKYEEFLQHLKEDKGGGASTPRTPRG